MAGRKYERLDIETFGLHLISTGDLDPIYIALHRMLHAEQNPISFDQLYRWLIAYWCLYHAGSACWISEHEGEAFWNAMWDAADNTKPAPVGGRWQRGHERRHFRGTAALKAVGKLRETFPQPENLVAYLLTGQHDRWRSRDTISELPFGVLSGRAQELPLFGPWISFKICDMVDRVLGHKVNFSGDDVFMFKDPTKAAIMLWNLKAGHDPEAKPRDEKKAIADVVEYLTNKFSDLKAPPRGDRPIGLQEVETVLCKWKSHMNGHYPLFNDIDEINAGVEQWQATSRTARQFMSHAPKRISAS